MTDSEIQPPSTPPAVETPPIRVAPTVAGKQNLWQNRRLLILLLVLIASLAVLVIVINPQGGQPSPVSQPPRVSPVPQALTLSIESPQNETAVVENKVLIKGKTRPQTAVIIYSETDDTSAESDNQGNFQGEITLMGGINTLTITAFGENGEEKTVTLDVVYDQES